jgi:hypothetical protein
MDVGPVVFIGMETSGALRSRFQMAGFFTISCDTLPAEDGSRYPEAWQGRLLGGHIQGDVFDTLAWMWDTGLWPKLAVFHPTCTYMTVSAEWAYKDPDFDRYPEVGYHQKPKPETLVGAPRREARERSLAEVRRLMELPIERKIIENPIGVISTCIRKPLQIHQPYLHGDDASKATCAWYIGADGADLPDMIVPVDPTKRVSGRVVNGLERWDNQTDSGQNKLGGYTKDRWKERSRTYPGLADSWVAHWKGLISA